MIKLTVEKSLIAKDALKEFDGKSLPSKLSYWLGRTEDKLNPVEKSFNKIKEELIKKLGEHEKDGEGKETGQIKVSNDKIEEYMKEINSVLQATEEVPALLKLEMFEGVEVTKDFFIKMGELVSE